ncbi:GNAT family N-acetyltransferase [Pseudoalteromonas citrea]|uniref:GNAT family N-acetyltransferase n=1 Tax=Pseudoalteromonas citrea TaxID=43655 RepID=A0A5S3XNE1_9GAMM|nr:GNAT family N-acetyltransferase [Pseudoalteromonas citrea]TMP43016.1 GNAT family N-acetyltransferase [Pseudoalteromonas citrea]TMP58420.1 GNAT family N-acetyltransferase [Pseudoalteromonas citrea]
MIRRLDNTKHTVATQIYDIFQASYQIEAALIGIAYFPPLARTIDDINAAQTQFYGYFEEQELAAIVEISMQDTVLSIESLTVSPAFFRKGIARKLLCFVMEEYPFSRALVETAAVNAPAIALYKKQGFVAVKKWTPAHGIEKVAMSISSTEHS